MNIDKGYVYSRVEIQRICSTLPEGQLKRDIQKYIFSRRDSIEARKRITNGIRRFDSTGS